MRKEKKTSSAAMGLRSRGRPGQTISRNTRGEEQSARYPLVVWRKYVTLLFCSRKAKIASCVTLFFIFTTME